ncbi:MAG: CBS domain-containing protein [Gammaproteobacteria bacterium]|nr:CBS domain-containing protein [Gammaproteobacteria bacterium]
MSQFRVLSAGTLDAGVGIQRPHQDLPSKVTLDSPASTIMTDLTRVTAESVTANIPIDEAEQQMIASGVRLLFVTNPMNHVIGIITSKDLSNERILRVVNDTHTPRKELSVRDIMTPQHRIDVLEMADVSTASVGDIVSTLKRMGRQHALVVDRDPQGAQTIRGLLSTTQIGRQLGEAIDTKDVAGSFAELARVS